MALYTRAPIRIPYEAMARSIGRCSSGMAGATAAAPTQRTKISRHSSVSERGRLAGPCHSAAIVRRGQQSRLRPEKRLRGITKSIGRSAAWLKRSGGGAEEGQVCLVAEQGGYVGGGHGAREQVALTEAAAERPQLCGLRQRLDTFGDRYQREALRQRHNGTDDRAVGRVFIQPGHKGPVDLQHAHGKLLEIRQRRVGRAKVVND